MGGERTAISAATTRHCARGRLVRARGHRRPRAPLRPADRCQPALRARRGLAGCRSVRWSWRRADAAARRRREPGRSAWREQPRQLPQHAAGAVCARRAAASDCSGRRCAAGDVEQRLRALGMSVARPRAKQPRLGAVWQRRAALVALRHRHRSRSDRGGRAHRRPRPHRRARRAAAGGAASRCPRARSTSAW